MADNRPLSENEADDRLKAALDELGSDLVPDYLTSVNDGGFYGWPYSYYGQHVDPRVPAKPEIVAKAIVPITRSATIPLRLG